MSDLTVRPQDLGIGRLFEEVRDAVIVAEATTGRIVLWNRAATQIFGYSPAEALGLRIEALVPERLQAQVSRYRETDRAAYDSRRLAELPAVRKGGGEIRIEMSLIPFARIHDAGEADARFVLAIVREVTERKRTLDRLGESERRFATVLANARAYAYRCRNEEGYPNEFASDYALELTGYPSEDLMVGGRVRFGDLIVEEDRERVWEEVQGALGSTERFELRYTIRRRDGELRHVEEFGQGIYDEEGEVVALEGIVYDVTERERVVERLREAETRYRTLVEGIPAIVYIEEMNGRMTTLYDSPQIENMLGYPQGKHLEDPDYWIKILHPDDKERVLADERRAIARGEPLSQEYRIVAADGRTVWVRDDAVVVRDAAGEPLYWQGFIFDITHRKEAEERLRASEAELRALFEAMTDVILVLDREGRYLKIAPTNPSLLYRPSAELLGKTLHEVFPKEQADMFLGHIRDALGTRETVTFEYGLQIEDRQVWFEATVSPMLEDSVIIVARDISERRKNEEALRRSEAGLAEAQRMAHLGNWEWDVRTDEVWWSDEVFRIYGFEPGAFTPSLERLIEVVHPDDRPLVTERIEAALYQGDLYDFEHRILRPDGEVRWVHRQAEVVRGEEGEPLRMVGTIHDITDRRALEEQLAHQALHDPLTELPNRVLFTDRLRQSLSRAKRRHRALAIMFMDLDNFKVINDSLGHETGDKLLVIASKRIRSILRPEDTLARLGGDEFVFLLEDTDLDDAIRVAERILGKLRKPFPLSGRRFFVTASIGIIVGSGNGKRAADLLRNADLAMYRAKHSGKARYAIFEEAMNAQALERLELEHGLRRAVERDEFIVQYQPEVSLATKKVVGFETLVRWEHPERGLLPPDEFVP